MGNIICVLCNYYYIEENRRNLGINKFKNCVRYVIIMRFLEKLVIDIFLK